MSNKKKKQTKIPSFDEIAKPIITNKEYLKRKKFAHHEDESVYDHCMMVAKYAYKWAIKCKNVDVESTTIAALLHDFYTTPWQTNIKKNEPLFEKHGFIHARVALENSRKYFPDLMNDIVEDAILRHMFPLNIKPPKYKESWIVNMSDNIVSLNVFKHPTKLLKYVGIKPKDEKEKKNNV